MEYTCKTIIAHNLGNASARGDDWRAVDRT